MNMKDIFVVTETHLLLDVNKQNAVHFVNNSIIGTYQSLFDAARMVRVFATELAKNPDYLVDTQEDGERVLIQRKGTNQIKLYEAHRSVLD